MVRRHELIHFAYRWVSQVMDPRKLLRAVPGFARYFADYAAYKRMGSGERMSPLDTFPQIHDRTTTTRFDPHYFYSSGWAMRRIVASAPGRHMDVGSHNFFANLLSAVVPVTFVDYRPLKASISGLDCVAGDILCLDNPSGSVRSLSCLHVAEHIGLGRYGDPLDPRGTERATAELARILAPGGNLFFAVPVGRARVCFNAHRVHSVQQVLAFFSELRLVEFSGVTDDGEFLERVPPGSLDESHYACGLFWFQKKAD